MNKKQILATIVAFLFSCLIVVVGMHPNSIYARIAGVSSYEKSPRSIYRVYLAGESLGIINSKKELENYIDQKQQEIKDKYNVDKVYAPSDLKIVKELTYNEKISKIEDIYSRIEKIKGKSSFTIDGYKIEIEGLDKRQENSSEIKEDASEQTEKAENIVFYVLDKKVFENSVTKTITAFIDPETYEAYLNDTQKPIEEKKTGSHIDNIHIDNNIKIIKQRIPAEENIYTTESELSKFLLFGTTAEQKKYTVQDGDTISEIANNNKLSIEEFLIANTNFKSENDLLFTGQVVNLGLITPQFDLVEERTLATEKPIQKGTVYKDDNTQYVGYEKVEEEGKDGLALVTEVQKLINGEIKDTVQTEKVTMIPSIDKVIIRGTKKKEYTPSIGPGNVTVPVGIGSWVWPTNTPYTISSPFGYRWGKLHDGIDITGPGYGSPIKAANNGVIVQSGYTGYNGNYIIIAHSDGRYTYYGHMSSRYKQVGDTVMANDVIGAMGSTGYAFGVHLHFSIYNGYPWRGGVAFNPFNMYR